MSLTATIISKLRCADRSPLLVVNSTELCVRAAGAAARKKGTVKAAAAADAIAEAEEEMLPLCECCEDRWHFTCLPEGTETRPSDELGGPPSFLCPSCRCVLTDTLVAAAVVMTV
eukprot:18841-Heterococcus_DN1.PRE.1